MDNLNWEFAWIWVYIQQIWDDNPKIVEVISWSPASEARLQANDEIISIDWRVLSDFSSPSSFIDALKGEVWSRVQVWIKRGNQSLFKIITRAIIKVPSVEMTKKWGVCYINIYSFDNGSKNIFFDKINELGVCDEYIFDLRSNPGGVIDEVIWILDKFVPYWNVIMTEKWVNGSETVKSREVPKYILNKSTYVLIDNYTASAAEIFAWVLKYYYPNSVKLVGAQSYGKGSVQQVVQFPNDEIIKYTIALRYVADQETSIDKIWLTPDIFVVDNPYTTQDEVLEKIGFKLDS
jgi:carboxyl-terminal processing protease